MTQVVIRLGPPDAQTESVRAADEPTGVYGSGKRRLSILLPSRHCDLCRCVFLPLVFRRTDGCTNGCRTERGSAYSALSDRNSNGPLLWRTGGTGLSRLATTPQGSYNRHAYPLKTFGELVSVYLQLVLHTNRHAGLAGQKTDLEQVVFRL